MSIKLCNDDEPDDGSKTRAWVFTFWNTTAEELAEALDKNEIDYAIFGNEICPETGREHVQSYIKYKSARYWTALCKLYPNTRIRKAKGNALQNYNYCSKEGDFVEIGTRPKQGARTDLLTVKKAVKEGSSVRTIIEKHAVNYQSIKMAETMMKYFERKRTWRPEVIWLWGATGTGKTEHAKRLCNNDYCMSQSNSKWWNEYDAHENVIIDEIREDWIPFKDLLGLLGEHAYTIETKGGTRQFLAKKIIITAPVKPQVMFALIPEDICQLLRRIDKIIEIRRSSKFKLKMPEESVLKL